MKIIKSLIVLFAVTVSMVACKNEAATEATTEATTTETTTTETTTTTDTAAMAPAADTAMAK